MVRSVFAIIAEAILENTLIVLGTLIAAGSLALNYYMFQQKRRWEGENSKLANQNLELEREKVRLEKENVSLQRSVAKLAEKQAEIIRREENKTNISVKFVSKPNHTYAFMLTNEGRVEARNIHYAHYLGMSYQYTDDSKTVFIERLYPGNTYPITVAFDRGPRNCEIIYSWDNPDGTRTERERQPMEPGY